jgi:hypothetical protein
VLQLERRNTLSTRLEHPLQNPECSRLPWVCQSEEEEEDEEEEAEDS